jgi:nucleoside-diphosphate-sugar epimerase
MQYLVTGGCGFIGSHIAEALVAEGHAVKIFDDLSSGHERNLAAFRKDVEFIRGDIRSSEEIQKAMKGVQFVFHQAALVSVFDSIQRPEENNASNITGTLNVLMAARDHNVRRVVFAGSAAAYGNNPELPKRESMRPEPESPYGLAKVAGEYYMGVFARLYKVETVTLRYFNVYGPRQDPKSTYSGVISRFMDAMARGQSPTVFGDGLQTRDFVFVKDVVQANLLAMRTPGLGKGEVFNVGTGRQTSLQDLLGVLNELNGRQFAAEFREARAGDIRSSVADITQARQRLAYSPNYDIRQGLRELLS